MSLIDTPNNNFLKSWQVCGKKFDCRKCKRGHGYVTTFNNASHVEFLQRLKSQIRFKCLPDKLHPSMETITI